MNKPSPQVGCLTVLQCGGAPSGDTAGRVASTPIA